jgi:glycosyltransferase involved in cell wall biosynthesis
MEKPFISVIIPAFNAEKYISDAINSIFAQNYQNLEILVIDDVSTDNTLSVLESFGNKIKIFKQEKNMGPAVARNVGIRNAKGSIIGFVDADDIWTLDHLEKELPYLRGDEYDFVRGYTKFFKNEENTKKYSEPLFMESLVGASLYKKSIIDKVGLFDEDMRQGEDLDWHIRFTEYGAREKRLTEPMLIYRRHDKNLTNDPESVKTGQMSAFRKKLARKRLKQTNE